MRLATRGRLAKGARYPNPRSGRTSIKKPIRRSTACWAQRPRNEPSERQGEVKGCYPAILDEFRKANAKRLRCFFTTEAIIKAVKVACEKPYREGFIEERKFFMDLMTGEQLGTKSYFFFAQ